MFLLAPARTQDQAEILNLARMAGIGMTSLPPDSHILQQKIDTSTASFAGKPSSPKGERFLFTLQDTQTKQLIGTTGIIAHVGLQRPFYSYKLSTLVQANERLGVYSSQRVLHMVNDYTGATEIGSLFLLPEFRRDGIGRFLSRARYLMMADFPHLFSDLVISEIRGVQDTQGGSPFYRDVVQHFFQMEYQRADFINATQGAQFIADLMPKYPIYLALLSQAAQAVIGVPLEASKPALQLLEHEGFRYQGYVDVLDAGPTVQVEREQIRTVRKSRATVVRKIEAVDTPTRYMISNAKLPEYRIMMAPMIEHEDGVSMSEQAAQLLGVAVGDPVRYALL